MTRKERGEEILRIIDDMYCDCFEKMVRYYHDLEELGCKAECKKMDTILGKLENLCHDFCDKARKLI